MNIDKFSKKCYVDDGNVSVDIDVFVELLEKNLGKNHPETIKWIKKQTKIHKKREQDHKEAVAWDDWKDSLATRNTTQQLFFK